MKKNKSLNHPFLKAADDLNNEWLRKAKSDGKKVIGYFCSYAPRELLDAGGLVHYRMRAPNITVTDVADTYLGLFNCSYTRCLLEVILDDTIDFIDGYVFTASCDHLRRLYDNLRYIRKPSLCHILDLPHKNHDDAIDWYTEELEMLRDEIEKSLGVRVGDDELSKSIKLTNELRRILSRIQELRKLPEPKLTGEEMHRIMIAVHSTPTEAAVAQLEDVYRLLEEREPPMKPRARLLIMGSQMDDPACIGAMEEMGAEIVADAFCEGSMHFGDEVDENAPPLKALASRYLKKLSCPRMFEDFNGRYNRVVAAAKENKVDGIVIEVMKFCDTWGIDAPLFINRLRAEGIETLRLEREYTIGGVGQLRTRVQAFMEMLGK